jgi:3-methylfumaryl-CoA hydratase
VSGLAGYFEGWWPEPLRRPDRIRRWPLDAFAGLLDQPGLAEDDPLPPMWQGFGFLDHPAQAELGADGHPAGGQFLPPIPNRRRMFAGGRWRAHQPLRVGDEVIRTASVTSIEVKNGRSGEMAFVTVRYEFAQDGVLAAVEEQDIVYRGGEPAEVAAPEAPTAAKPPAKPADQPEDSAPALRELRIAPDPPLLFRFSALTYNTHRIHYDQSYATGVEGYPGLVVHGPLLALLALELPRRAGRSVTEFRYRLRRPAFVGATIVSREFASDADGWSELTVGELDRPPSLTATARFGTSAGAASKGRE